jgi:hypothetical protein
MIKCCLLKPQLSWIDLAPRGMPIWNPIRSVLYCRISDILNANSIGILNAHTLLRLKSIVRGLAHRQLWYPASQSLHTGGFLLVVALAGLYYWSNLS